MSQNITITNNAALKIFSLMEEEEDFDLKLKIYITGGGCSGLQYNFTFTKEQTDEDFSFEKIVDQDEDGNEDSDAQPQDKKVILLIHALSMPYLDGATIDYKEDINGSQFLIQNPNASGSCGCGNSFGV